VAPPVTVARPEPAPRTEPQGARPSQNGAPPAPPAQAGAPPAPPVTPRGAPHPAPAPPPRVSRRAQAVRFLRVARLLLWTLWVIYRERRRVLRARARGEMDVRPDEDALIEVLVAFRKTALQLGVLMIKLGQFLSARADLLPERALKVLASLQDEVPPAPYAHVVATVERELGRPLGELFSSFEREPTAAASLGQVHRAVLAATGETVAVKVQRPNIEALVRTDLSTIRFVIWVVSRFMDTTEVLDLQGLYREFRRSIFEEIDYTAEAAHATRFRELFRDRPALFVPRVCEGYVARRVLVLEWVDGIKINDYAALERAGVDRREVARRTVEAYLFQFFEAGFFHADPHPGNIFVRPAAPDSTAAPDAGPVIAFVDFGMVGTLSRRTKGAFKDGFLGVLTGNAGALADALQRLGFIGPGADMAVIRRGIALLLEQYGAMSLGEVRNLDFAAVASELEDLLYSQPFRLPADLAFTGKAVGTLAGVATGLAPDLDLIGIAAPYARRFLGLGGGDPGQGAAPGPGRRHRGRGRPRLGPDGRLGDGRWRRAPPERRLRAGVVLPRGGRLHRAAVRPQTLTGSAPSRWSTAARRTPLPYDAWRCPPERRRCRWTTLRPTPSRRCGSAGRWGRDSARGRSAS
jgi:predicted unusual protein kinase regulating ubiquinone biosynthesis (AarF/ABC1/UbiB family)